MKSATDELAAGAVKAANTESQISFLGEKTGRAIIDHFLERLVLAAKDGPIKTPIGVFEWRWRAARKIRNFKGEIITIPRLRMLTFRAAKRFRGIR